MTKEEAINHIRYGIIEGNYPLPKELGIEACEMAIEALEQQPCDDCISRQAVLDMLEDINAETEGVGFYYEHYVEYIKKLSPIAPQPKTGHWIKYGIPRCGEQHYKCTSCGYYINFGQWGELYSKEFKYCPNCGAKMQEVEENDT